MANGKWKTRLEKLNKTKENDTKKTKKFQDALDKMTGPAQEFARVSVNEGAVMKLGMNQMEIQLTACIVAATALSGMEGDLEAAQKAKDKKKIADVEKKMKPHEKAHDTTTKQGKAAQVKTEAAIQAIKTAGKTLKAVMA